MSNCGVKAKKVLPVYPSKTFVNHYSQVTGLYPIYHGLIDNIFWDKEINSTGKESMPKTKNSNYFKGIPIWEHYMNLGGRANCFFWVGSEQRKCTEYKIYAKDKDIPFEERIEIVRRWLNLPEKERPGLITLYFDEPDSTGHWTGGDLLRNKKIERMVRRMDLLIYNLLQGLYEDGILNCINIAILSDHGLTGISENINITNLVVNATEMSIGGPIARIYMDNAEEFVAKVAGNCSENKKNFLITTNQNRPARLHHSGRPSIGDVVLEARLGKGFLVPGRVQPKGNHGYDYLHPEMNGIFLARGPAFKSGAILPPVQNHEFFNLWLELLRMDPANYPSNATIGLFDSILINPSTRPVSPKQKIPPCLTSSNTVKPCCLQEESPCSNAEYIPDIFGSSLPFCKDENFCGKRIYITGGELSGLFEVVTEKWLQTTCQCGGYSADSGVNVPLEIRGTFITNVMNELNKLQRKLLQKFKKIYVLSGAISDQNYDEIADEDQRTASTHFYRLYLFCNNSIYSETEEICDNKEDLVTNGFVFPLIETDPNCLKGEELLSYYTATVKDIESLTGLDLRLKGYTFYEEAIVKIKIK